METRITATELARNLSDVLNRVRYRGESFRVERNGEVVAEIKPAALEAKKSITVREFIELWPTIPKPDPEYWEDVADAIAEQQQLPESPW